MRFENISARSPKDLARFMIEWEDNVKRETIVNGGRIDYELMWRRLIELLEK